MIEWYKNRRVGIAGSGGLIGRELSRQLESLGSTVLGWRRQDGDLCCPKNANAFVTAQALDCVFVVAGEQGGVADHIARPFDYGLKNALITSNVINACISSSIDRLVYCSSTAVYADQQGSHAYVESDIGTGRPDQVHISYAAAKLLGIRLCESASRQYGYEYKSAVLTNVFGPGGEFDERKSTLIHGLIGRALRSLNDGTSLLSVWGSGIATRDVLFVEDAARALLVIGASDYVGPVNVASGKSLLIRDIAAEICRQVGISRLEYDPTKPEGAKERKINIDLLQSLGFHPKVKFEEAVWRTIDYVRKLPN